jgi:hypothetical protein
MNYRRGSICDLSNIKCNRQTKKWTPRRKTIIIEVFFLNLNWAQLLTEYCPNVLIGVHGEIHYIQSRRRATAPSKINTIYVHDSKNVSSFPWRHSRMLLEPEVYGRY